MTIANIKNAKKLLKYNRTSHSILICYCTLAFMKKALLLILLFQLTTVLGQKNSINATFEASIAIQADSFVNCDGFGSYYYLENSVFYKKNKDQIWSYKNQSLGKITKAAGSNPLRIILFYENFNSIVLLDNQLNEIQKINFSENATPIVAAAVGLAAGNQIWVYNSLSQQIGLFDYLQNTYKNISTPFVGILKTYSSNFNYFQWIDEKSDWYSCNAFGTIIKIGRVPDFDEIQLVTETTVIFKKNNCLYYFDMVEESIRKIEIVEKSFKNYSFKDKILSIFTDNKITNYTIKLP